MDSHRPGYQLLQFPYRDHVSIRLLADILAAGIPVITTTKAIEGLDRNIKKVIFLEDKFDNYPKRIMELLDDPKSLHLYSGHGKRFVAECYSWNTQAYRYLDVYESLLENTL